MSVPSNMLLSTAFTAALALLAAPATAAPATKEAPQEKCYGIAKAGQNDCADAAGTHSCAGKAKKDGLAAEWKYVPKGTCEKQGGRTFYLK